MKKINVVLSGLSPLLMHNVESMMESSSEAKAGTKKYDPVEEARKGAYTTQIKGKTVLCVPNRCVYGMILRSASYFKIKGRNVQSTIAGAIDVMPENIPLTLKGAYITNYVIDKRSVVIQKARIIRCRPRIDKWELEFELVYNEDYIADDKLLRKIIQDGGIKVGLLNFRPEKKGTFDNNKKYVLIDGKHRIEAVEMNGGDYIQAQVHKGLGEKEIYLMAVDINSKHGIRLTRNDKLWKVIPRLTELKVDAARISQLTGIEAAEFEHVKTRSIRSDERVSMMSQRIGTPDNFHEAMIRGGSDITIEDAKGGVLLKAKEKTANVLKEFVGRKMRMKVENNSIILQEVD